MDIALGVWIIASLVTFVLLTRRCAKKTGRNVGMWTLAGVIIPVVPFIAIAIVDYHSNVEG
jgi:hypothetical protein